MFNTPLGRKLYENMASLGYHIMSGKASMYSNVNYMVDDFIDLNDGNVYFKKRMSKSEIEKLILYINDGTDYRIDIKLNPESPVKSYITTFLNQEHIGFDDIENISIRNVKINELKNIVGIWNDTQYDKLTMVINTGLKDKSVLNIDVVLV